MHSRLSRGGKTLADLKYSAVVDSLLAAVPEIKRQHDADQEAMGPDVLPYLTFELVLEPFVKDLLRTKAEDELLRRVFTFLEEMAGAQDIEVVNLLHIAIFEAWAGDRETLARAWKYMGERTKLIAADAAHRLNLGDNLPRAARS